MFSPTRTLRGFTYASFEDRYGAKCSIQKSSLAFEEAIWFGVDDPDPQIMAVDAPKYGVHTAAVNGWVKYPIPDEVSLTTRMHLTQEQVQQILPVLQHFAETGELPDPGE